MQAKLRDKYWYGILPYPALSVCLTDVTLRCDITNKKAPAFNCRRLKMRILEIYTA